MSIIYRNIKRRSIIHKYSHWMSIKDMLIKTLLRKNPMEKKISVKEKEYNIICVEVVLLKTLLWKPIGTKLWWKKKLVKNMFISPPYASNHFWDEEGRSFVLIVQKFCLSMTLFKDLLNYHMIGFVNIITQTSNHEYKYLAKFALFYFL